MVVLVARPVKTIIVLMTIKVKSGRQKKAKGRQKGREEKGTLRILQLSEINSSAFEPIARTRCLADPMISTAIFDIGEERGAGVVSLWA